MPSPKQEQAIEQLDQRQQGGEAVVAACFLHELPDGAQLKLVEARKGRLADIRNRIEQVKAEIAKLERTPVPSADIADRITRYVADLATKARPQLQNIEGGELKVLFPLDGNAHVINLSGCGFVPDQANALLLAAYLFPERLVENLLQSVAKISIPRGERDRRLTDLQAELTRLRYDEEAAICLAIERGEDVTRGPAPAWAT